MTSANPVYTFPDLMRDLWRARQFIAGGVVAGLLCAAVFIVLCVPQYKAQMTLSPANPMNGAEASSLLADDNLFALRYLVQRVGVANSSDFLRFENKYNGASVAAVLLRDDKIRRGMAADKTIHFTRARDDLTPAALAAYIAKRVKISPVGATSLRRMTYTHADPVFADYFLTRLHMVTDELIRRKIKSDAADRIDYLSQTIIATGNQEHRRALTTLLMEQERLRMLVSIETPYAAAVVEPAAVTDKPIFPRGSILYPVFAVLGAFVGFVASGFVIKQEIKIVSKPVSAKQWFKADAANMTRRPLTKGDTQTRHPEPREGTHG
jgi:uncharacterized protein involved in exopolysaccharide biosynthesis